MKQKFLGLFAKERIGVTWRLMTCEIMLGFVGSGMTFLTPFMLHTECDDNGF